jgi:CheY-like chemotaxis protein
MPDGGELSIAVAPHHGRRQQALLTVQDTGRGMSNEVKAKVFEPFFTTKSREHGTGLGLSIVHGIVSEHDGTIEVDSKPGEGATVRILLPTCSPAGDFSRPFVEPVEGAGRTVLLAEDNDNVRRGIAQQLEELGFRVIEAANGKEAVAVVCKQPSDVALAILDVDLPRKSGIECLREIHEQMPGFPAILISGVPSVDLESLHATFLRKPFTKAMLTEAIQSQFCCDTEPVRRD